MGTSGGAHHSCPTLGGIFTIYRHLLMLKYLQKSSFPPTMWWCPMGPFAFLPIHAAGMYHTERMETVSDYMVSSYTLNLRTLVRVRDIPLAVNPFKMMVVVQPDSAPNTMMELEKIEHHVPAKCLVKLVCRSVKEAVAHLQGVSIAHFACHGQQDS